MKREITDRLLTERVSGSYTPGAGLGLQKILSQYPKLSEYTKRLTINSLGDITENHLDIHVTSIANPHYENEVAILTAGQSVMQIIKATSKDWHSIIVPIKATSGIDNLIIDNFNQYADTAALRLVWVPIGGPLINPQLATIGAYEGGKCMTIDFKNNVTQYVERTYGTAQDWSNYYSFDFWHSSSQYTTNSSMRIRIGDVVGNFAYFDIPVGLYLNWHQHVIPFSLFTDEAGNVNFSQITKIQFMVLTYGSFSTEFIDLIQLNPNVDATLYFQTRIYSFGSTFPIAGTPLPTPMTLDDGSTFVSNFVKLVRSFIEIEFTLGHAHSGGNPLTIGNYYGIEIKNVEANSIVVYGLDNGYQDGTLYAVSGSQLGTDLEKNMGFFIGSHEAGYVYSVHFHFNADPGYRSRLIIIYKDLATDKILGVPVIYSLNSDDVIINFNFLDSGIEYFVDENKFLYVYFQPNENTRATELTINVKGCHKFGL